MNDKMLRVVAEPTPFCGDADYVDAELTWLKIRAARLGAKQEFRAAVAEENNYIPARLSRHEKGAVGELRRRMEGLLAKENECRAGIDLRLQARRCDTTAPKLGLDRLCQEHALTEQERLILLVSAVPGLGKRLFDEVLGALPDCYCAVSVTTAIELLDPASAKDWLRLRRLFRGDSALRRGNLIVVGMPGREAGPDSLMTAGVQLSLAAFSVLVGDAGILKEGEQAKALPGPQCFGMN
jgi:hypothetical protein